MKASDTISQDGVPLAIVNAIDGLSLPRRGALGWLPSVRALSSTIEWGMPPLRPLAADSILLSTQIDLSRELREKVANTPSGSYMLALNLLPFRGTAFVDGKEASAGLSDKGTVHICPPGASVRLVSNEVMASAHLFFPELLISQTYEELELRQTSVACELLPILSGVRDPILEDLIMILVQEKAKQGSSGKLFADSVGLAILTHLIRRHSNKLQERDDRSSVDPASAGIRQAKEYIEHHLVYPLGLADLAKSADMSIMHFATRFRSATGLSPHQYVLMRRIEKSKRLLTLSRVPVKCVAAEVGFETSSHFCVVFKRLVGESPARWRRMI